MPSEYIDAVRASGGIPILLPPGKINPALNGTLCEAMSELLYRDRKRSFMSAQSYSSSSS
jgi:hypothetical protein